MGQVIEPERHLWPDLPDIRSAGPWLVPACRGIIGSGRGGRGCSLVDLPKGWTMHRQVGAIMVMRAVAAVSEWIERLFFGGAHQPALFGELHKVEKDGWLLGGAPSPD